MINRFLLNLVAADVSRLKFLSTEIRADSRRLLRIRIICRVVFLAIFCLWSGRVAIASTEGQTNISPLLEIGGNTFAGWSGFASTSKGVASLAMPGEAIFVYPKTGRAGNSNTATGC